MQLPLRSPNTARPTGFAFRAIFVALSLLIVLPQFTFAQLTAEARPQANEDRAKNGRADKKGGETEDDFSFVRLVKNDDGDTLSLDVAIVRYVPKDGGDGFVDLVGAVHVADEGYFKELNRRFRDYESVLYELVAPEGTRIPKGGVERDSMVSMMQGGMTDVLGLSFQLDEIDYMRKNFVHADMTPEEFANSMKDRGESMFSIIIRAMSEGMARQTKDPASGSEIKLLAALFSAHREHDLKTYMAEQFADMDHLMSAFGGEDGSTLVTERNKKALLVLQQELQRGKTEIAIFYGAGHMEDMEQRLENEFGMKRKSVTWLTAWDLSQGLAKKKAAQARRKKKAK